MYRCSGICSQKYQPVMLTYRRSYVGLHVATCIQLLCILHYLQRTFLLSFIEILQTSTVFSSRPRPKAFLCPRGASGSLAVVNIFYLFLINYISRAYICLGGSVAEWFAYWTQAQKGLGSNRSRDAVG